MDLGLELNPGEKAPLVIIMLNAMRFVTVVDNFIVFIGMQLRLNYYKKNG